jgi:hypothetical protein
MGHGVHGIDVRKWDSQVCILGEGGHEVVL